MLTIFILISLLSIILYYILLLYRPSIDIVHYKGGYNILLWYNTPNSTKNNRQYKILFQIP